MKGTRYNNIKKNRISEIYLVLIIVVTLSMGIVYAEISSVENDIRGTVEASMQEGVIITDIKYLSNNGADETNSSINYFVGTMFDSKIVLGNTNDSSITYEVTIYNNTDKDQLFIDTLTDKTNINLYSNQDIVYSIEGLEKYTTKLMPETSITFTITFSYKEGISISNNILTCKLNFRFKENPIIVLSNEGNNYELSDIYPDYSSKEYKFTIMNYEGTNINNVPMNYTLKATVDKPLNAKIYDDNGNEVTGNINIAGDGQTQVVHNYTLKIIWDNNNTVENIQYNSIEYADKELSCNLTLNAIPDDTTEYMDYSIKKQFKVNITTLALNVDLNIDSTTGLFENSSSECSYKISIKNNNSIPINYKVKGSSTNELNLNGANIDTVIQANSQNETSITITPVENFIYMTDVSEIDVYVDIISPYNAIDYKKYTISINTYGTNLRKIIENKYTINTSTPDFRENITTTTNSGVFQATEVTGKAYYFRGVIDNNYVSFANKLWRIMRVNGDGTIRLILDSPLNNSMTYNYSTTSTNTNFNTSAVKSTIETWYASNLQNYNQYINQNAIFLYDRRASSASIDVFKSWERLYNASPLINTSGINANYLYTVNTNNGNGYLNYPIGLATSDEIMMAGAVITDNSTTTLPSGDNSNLKPNYTFYIANDIPSGVGIWTMSPFSSTAVMVFKSQVGFYKETPTSKRLVKPVIELNSNIEFKGKGTESNPFKIYK